MSFVPADRMSSRDNFSRPTIRKLSESVRFQCSNPDCQRPTMGPDGGDGSVSIGVAAHITAASPGGPRYDATLSAEERSSAENGIWLCQTCSRLIDVDETSYPNATIREWKRLAEMRAYLAVRNLEIVAKRSFEKLEKLMPELVTEMRCDLADQPFTREFIVISNKSSYGGQERPFFATFTRITQSFWVSCMSCEIMERFGISPSIV